MTTGTEETYNYYNAQLDATHDYLLPTVLARMGQPSRFVRVFDLGCGNGAVAGEIDRRGWSVTGVDASSAGIAQARQLRPHVALHHASAYDDLASRFGQFDYVISLEVVEHIYAPRDYARTLFNLTRPGGTAIVSTPYHSYFKNLAMAATGRLDAHFTALWDGGHIKFWSIATLSKLLTEAGFSPPTYARVGRFPLLAKSMIATAQRP